MRFLAFVEALGVTLTPAQRVCAAVFFDGAEPGSFTGSDSELAAALFGPIDVVPPEAREVLLLLKGARVGGSYIFAGLASLWSALFADLSTLAPGEQAVALVVAPDLRLARQVLRYAHGAAMGNPKIAPRVLGIGSEQMLLQRENGHRCAVQCLPATRGGSATRGRSFVSAVLTEAGFFRDADYVVNDAEILRAVAPRIMKGGRIVIESTPWTAAGLVYETYSENWGAPKTALVAHAPTLLMRPDARTRSIVERERQRDPDNAVREFDAQFASGGTTFFFDPSAIDRCVRPDHILPSLPWGHAHAGADTGFTSDSSAIAVLGAKDGSLRLLALDEQRPSKTTPLVPSRVVARFAEVLETFRVTRIHADAHYQEALREHLKEHKLQLVSTPAGQDGKAQSYLELKRLINEGRLILPSHPRLLAQLKSITSVPTPGGGLSIKSPRRSAGGHGDLVSALVAAAWAARERPRAMGSYIRTCDPFTDPIGFHPSFGVEGAGLPDYEILRAARSTVSKLVR